MFVKILSVFSIFVFAVCAQEVKLPTPQKTGGMPLMEALANRQSSREFSDKELSNQQLSDLLWAMWGINRSDGKRTAPSASNKQPIELYIIKKEGTFKYNAQKNSLVLVKAGDNRKIAGGQSFSQKAPLNILLIANTALISNDKTQNQLTASMDAGFIAQNAYLYCASEKLNCVARMSIDINSIRKTLGLNDRMYPVMGLTIGM